MEEEYFPRLSYMPQAPSITLREDYLRFCDGYYCAALLLEIFGSQHDTNAYCLEMKRTNILEERKKFVLDESELYLYVNIDVLRERLILDFEPEHIELCIDLLVEKGALRMVIDKDGMDRYLLEPDVVNCAVYEMYRGYNCFGVKIA